MNAGMRVEVVKQSMEGMWSVEFTAPGHPTWHGIAVFVGDQMFGGDHLFYWYGKNSNRGGKLEGNLESVSHTGYRSEIFLASSSPSTRCSSPRPLHKPSGQASRQTVQAVSSPA